MAVPAFVQLDIGFAKVHANSGLLRRHHRRLYMTVLGRGGLRQLLWKLSALDFREWASKVELEQMEPRLWLCPCLQLFLKLACVYKPKREYGDMDACPLTPRLMSVAFRIATV